MNKKITSIAGSALLAMSVSAANAVTYNVSSSFTDPNNFFSTSGSVANAATAVDMTISGTVETDTDQAGYSILGGTINFQGWVAIAFQGSSLYQTYDLTGDVMTDGSGFILNSGTYCIGTAVGVCDSAPLQTLDPTPGNEATWFKAVPTTASWNGGYAGSQGVNMLGGAGGDSFTTAFPGIPGGGAKLFNDTATMAIAFYGNPGAYFLAGDLQWTKVPVPAAAWLFGSALLGLVGVGRRRSA